MSQSGDLVFYRSTDGDPRMLLDSLFRATRPEFLSNVYRSLKEDRGWDVARQSQGPAYDDPDDDEDFDDPEPIQMEIVEKGPFVSPDKMAPHFRKGLSLSTELMKSPMTGRIWNAIYNGLPESIRGEFVPDSLFVTIGFHDLFEFAEHPDEGFYIARPFLSVRFWGQRSPRNWPGFRASVFALPEVLSVQAELEAALGPLDRCVYWDV